MSTGQSQPLAHVDRHRSPGVLTVVITGEIDLSNAADIDHQITAALAQPMPHGPATARAARSDPPTYGSDRPHIEMMLDLSGVTFLDSAALRVIINHTRAGQARVIAPPGSPAFRLLDLAHLTHLVTTPVADATTEASSSGASSSAANRGDQLPESDPA